MQPLYNSWMLGVRLFWWLLCIPVAAFLITVALTARGCGVGAADGPAEDR